MNKIELPNELIHLKDAIVDHINSGTALPSNLDQLEKWFEEDGWDLLVDDGLVGYALDLLHIANFRFDDSELRYEYELEESTEIMDALRIEYGHTLIEEAMKEYEGDVCPSVHCINLSDGKKTAVLGCLIEIHGQGGAVSYWQGSYKDQGSFIKAIRAKHVVMFDDIKNISDQEILNLWNRE